MTNWQVRMVAITDWPINCTSSHDGEVVLDIPDSA